jgi:zinc transport system substrate-binding protein
MFKKLLILISLFGFTTQANAEKIKIITSISPLASVFAMIAGDKATITSMCSANQCPHHYFVKPNQLWHLNTANLVVYIDDDFEIFMNKPLENYKGKVLKFSDNPDLITKVNNQTNWHVWLSTKNLKVIMRSTFKKLSEMDNKNTEFYHRNYQASYNSIEQLEDQMQKRLAKLPKPILLDSSLDYFFSNFKAEDQISKFYSSSKKMTPDRLSEIKDEVIKTSSKCVFVSSHQNIERFQEMFGHQTKVIGLDTESWSFEGSYQKMLKLKMQNMIDLVASCV